MDCLHGWVSAPLGTDERRQVCIHCGAEKWESDRFVTVKDHVNRQITSIDKTMAFKVWADA